MVKHVERNFAGRALKLEAGRLAKQAAGSCLVQFGETVVLAAVTVSDNVSTLPFFPLTVEYREKAYAAGKIPGGFLKREGRPSDEEILSARVTDRSIRPLFPEGFKNEVQVFIYVLSGRAAGSNGPSPGPAERRRRAGRDGGLGGARDVQGALERPHRGGAGGPGGGRLDLETDVPAARVLGRGHGGVRLGGFDRHGRGGRARAERARDREGARGGAQGHPGAARRRDRAGGRHAAAQDGMDQGRAPGGPGGAGEAAGRAAHHGGAEPAGEGGAGPGARRAQVDDSGAARGRVPREVERRGGGD